MLLEDAKNHSIDYQPTVLPKECEEPLHLIEWDHLGEQCHDPVLAEDEDFDPLICEMSRQLRQFILDQGFNHLTVLVEAWKATHVHFFQMIVI